MSDAVRPSHKITFRPAEIKDVEEAVPLIFSSGPDAFTYIFADGRKGSAQEFLKYAFVRKGGEMGFTNHLVVERDGELAGIGAGWSGRRTTGFTLRIARKILGFYGLIRGLGVMIRGLKFEGMVRPPRGREYAIAHLGVQERMRSSGLGEKLILELIRRSYASDPSNFILDVSDINPRAKVLYERMGFQTTRHKASKLKRIIKGQSPVTVPGHSRMMLPKITD
jgi:ribosomal protein S18 acetylase RimI-like enzyme